MIDETKIMQYADGTLPIEEHEEVKKAIEADPKLKELYNTFKETGDLLFKLGNEIKSQPLPKNLQDKADILKTWKKPIVKESNSLNFFGLFNIQPAGMAAAFAMFFVGGIYVDNFISGKDVGKSNQVTALTQKVEATKDLKFRGMPSADEDLSTRVTNLYRYFNADQFIQDINSKLDSLEINDEFESSLEDNDGKKVKFILVENFDASGNNCKKVAFNEPLKLSSNDQGSDVSLDICKINNNYEITSINLSK
tara:strand:- start:176 stop:931 length:756 start_codon:yes stop_codon:yes gene_type:complete